MPMQFESIGAAMAMNGHGAYVWPVYMIAFLVVLFLILGPVLRSRHIMVERRGELRREQARQHKESAHAPDS
jgi:heme exporter protein D